MTGGHYCPGPDCDKDVPYDMLACPRHWYQVSKPVRAAVYRAWARSAGAGSDEHAAAIEAAIRQMRP